MAQEDAQRAPDARPVTPSDGQVQKNLGPIGTQINNWNVAAESKWSPEADAEVPGRTGWKCLRRLGVGIVGEVWLVQHERQGLQRAFKFCREQVHRALLENEKKIIDLLRGIADKPQRFVRVHGARLESPPLYLECEYVAGGNLFDWSRQEECLARMTVDERLMLFAEIAEAVADAHAHGFIHGDLKPENILMDQDAGGRWFPRLTDFGGAALVDPKILAEARLSELKPTPAAPAVAAFNLAGTLLYRAPEVDGIRPATLQQDVYSLGVLLFQVALGDFATPFTPGWTVRVPDELLKEDIAAATEDSPGTRLRDAAVLAQRVRTLNDRRVASAASRKIERQRDEADKRRKRLIAVARVAVPVLLIIAALLGLGLWRENRLRSDAERNGYFASVIGAGAAIESGEWNKARMLLAQAPEKHRNWEWGYFNALCDKWLLTMSGHSKPVRRIAYDSTGNRAVSASDDGTATIWNAKKGMPIWTLRHDGQKVNSAAFSRDGLRVVTASDDRTARVWDAETGVQVWSTPRQTHPINDAAFSPDGSKIVTASNDSTARIWEIATGKQLDPPLTHKHLVNMARFSPDGTLIATASSDKTAQIWDAATGKPRTAPLIHRERVNTIEFNATGTQIVTASEDCTAATWDTSSGKRLQTILAHGSRVLGASYSRTGDKVLTWSSDTKAMVSNAESGELLHRLEGHAHWVTSAAFSPDGTLIATGSQDETVRVWEVASGKPRAVLIGHGDVVNSIAWSPDGASIISASSDNTVCVWDVSGGQQPVTLGTYGAAVVSAAFDPSGTRVVTALACGKVPSDCGYGDVWDAATGRRLFHFNDSTKPLTYAEFSPDGKLIVTASEDGNARVYNASAGSLDRTLDHGHHLLTMAAFDAASARVVTACWDKFARVWSMTEQTEPVLCGPHEGQINTARFSKDGMYIVTASGRLLPDANDGSVIIWDASKQNQLAVFKRKGSDAIDAKFSPDGTCVAAAFQDGKAFLWYWASGQSIELDHGNLKKLSSITFRPDGARVVTSSVDKTAIVWDVATGHRLAALVGHSELLTSASFSPDGKRVVTASDDKTVRVWDADTGRELAMLTGPKFYTESVSFSADGKRIVAACGDGTARVWDSVLWRERFQELQARGPRR